MSAFCLHLAFMEEIANQVVEASRIASPGFTWGKSGNITGVTYLWNDTVASDKVGRIVPLIDAGVTNIVVANENANTFTVEVLKRLGPGSFAILDTVVLTAERTKTQIVTNAPLALGDELAVRISTGAAKNPVVAVIIKGKTS